MPSPNGYNRIQPRWPARTPMGLGGQWRPDMDPDAEALFLGTLDLLDRSNADNSRIRPLVRNANSALSQRASVTGRAVDREDTASVITSNIIDHLRTDGAIRSDAPMARAVAASRDPNGMIAATTRGNGHQTRMRLDLIRSEGGIPEVRNEEVPEDRLVSPADPETYDGTQVLFAGDVLTRGRERLQYTGERTDTGRLRFRNGGGSATTRSGRWSNQTSSYAPSSPTLEGMTIERAERSPGDPGPSTGHESARLTSELRAANPPSVGSEEVVDVSSAPSAAAAESTIRQAMLESDANSIRVNNGLNSSLIRWEPDSGTNSGTTFTVTWQRGGQTRVEQTESDYTAAAMAVRREVPNEDVNADYRARTPEGTSGRVSRLTPGESMTFITPDGVRTRVTRDPDDSHYLVAREGLRERPARAPANVSALVFTPNSDFDDPSLSSAEIGRRSRRDVTDDPPNTPPAARTSHDVIRPSEDTVEPLSRVAASNAQNPHEYAAQHILDEIPNGNTRGMRVRASQRAARIVDRRGRTVAYVRQRRGDYIIEFMRGDFSPQSAALMPGSARRVPRNAEGAGETYVIPYTNRPTLANAVHDIQHAAEAGPVARPRATSVGRRRQRPGFPDLEEETVTHNGRTITRLVGMAGISEPVGSGYGASPGEVQTGLVGEDRTFGIEAEIMGITHNAARRALKDRGLPVDNRSNYSAKSATAWLATEDGSIAGNPEIKFPPLTGDSGLDLLRHGLDALAAEGGRQGFQESYGLHVHIGAADLSRSERNAATQTYQNNRELMEQMIGVNRRNTQWAQQGIGSYHDSMEITDDHSKPTIEFRRLGSTLNPATVEGWIVMLRALVNKAKEDGTAIPAQTNMAELLRELGITGAQRRIILARAAAVARQSNQVSRQ